jgi:hypothetical protein
MDASSRNERSAMEIDRLSDSHRGRLSNDSVLDTPEDSQQESNASQSESQTSVITTPSLSNRIILDSSSFMDDGDFEEEEVLDCGQMSSSTFTTSSTTSSTTTAILLSQPPTKRQKRSPRKQSSTGVVKSKQEQSFRELEENQEVTSVSSSLSPLLNSSPSTITETIGQSIGTTMLFVD